MLTADAAAKPLAKPVQITTAGAPPPPAVIERTEALGFRINHVYGLTETYGPITICEWNPDWDGLDVEERARLKARQGLHLVTADLVRVVDAELRDVPADGETLGEVVMRGNNVMKGYFADEAATAEAFRGGWFHSGDLGVMHPDGYIELRDRAKDIIISGGENISTIEVEQALVRHPDVLEAAVVAIPDEKWGERPKAFVTLRPGATLTAEELIAFARETLPGFKAPDEIEFGELPKTSTGKVKKYELRERERARRLTLTHDDDGGSRRAGARNAAGHEGGLGRRAGLRYRKAPGLDVRRPAPSPGAVRLRFGVCTARLVARAAPLFLSVWPAPGPPGSAGREAGADAVGRARGPVRFVLRSATTPPTRVMPSQTAILRPVHDEEAKSQCPWRDAGRGPPHIGSIARRAHHRSGTHGRRGGPAHRPKCWPVPRTPSAECDQGCGRSALSARARATKPWLVNYAVAPASTVSTVPVMLLALAPSRNSTASATSSTSGSRRSALRRATCSRRSPSRPWVMSVSMNPGAIAFTLTPIRPTSRASDRVNPIIDAFVAP